MPRTQPHCLKRWIQIWEHSWFDVSPEWWVWFLRLSCVHWMLHQHIASIQEYLLPSRYLHSPIGRKGLKGWCLRIWSLPMLVLLLSSSNDKWYQTVLVPLPTWVIVPRPLVFEEPISAVDRSGLRSSELGNMDADFERRLLNSRLVFQKGDT